MTESIDAFEQTFDKGTKVYQAYLVLRDQQWHCRECEYQHTGITQIAGGSGIQGLERGTKSRRGIKIESGNHFARLVIELLGTIDGRAHFKLQL